MATNARLIACVLVLACVSAAEAAPERLVFVGNADFPPYQYLDDRGEPQGFNIELMRALARETGIRIDVRLEPSSTVLPLVERGDADLVSLAFTDARADRFTWLLPLWRLRHVALFNRDPGRPIRSLRDLAGERVIVVRQGVLWEQLQALPGDIRPHLVEVKGGMSYEQAAHLLREGAATVIVGNALQLRAHGIYRDNPTFREFPLRSSPYYLAAAPGREDLLPVFFAAFSRLQESGEFNAIVEHTLLAPVRERWWDGWGAYVIALLACAALALFAFLTWNRSLRMQVDARTAEISAVMERLKFHGHILSQVTDGIIVLTEERRVTAWNNGAAALFGITAANAIGRDAEALLGPFVDSRALDAIRTADAGTGMWCGETTIHRADRGVRYVEAVVQALRDGDGRPDGRLVVVHDIHERKLADLERRTLEQHLQHAQKLESLGVLAGGIAHDFNNLLVGMLGHAGLALAEAPTPSPLRERLQQIETCALRAAELTNQMLAYSGKGRFVVEPTDLSAVVREMANLLQTAISKSARVDLHLGQNLPAMAADITQIRQVVMNLITNGSDAIGDRSGTITVTTGTMRATREYLSRAYTATDAEPGAYVFIEVRDTGCGMDTQTRQRIFEPFFTTKVQGRGLGLAAVLGIVRGHRGAVHIDSAPGEGTTFRILFPATGRSVEARAADTSRPRASRQARVLVVDDEPAVRAIARDTLTRAGFTVLVAEDGPRALAQMQDAAVLDAVLVDMSMPGMNGIDTLRAMRALAPTLPIVLTSGYSEQEAQDRCDGETLAGFIQKPFAPAALVAKMNEAIAT